MMDALQTDLNTSFIRPAEWRDCDRVYAFLCELEHQTLDSCAFRAIFRHNLNTLGVYYLVAEVADEVVGFVSCHVQFLLHHVGKVGEIQELFVQESHRNRGVGHQFIHALDALANRHSFVGLEVTTNRIRADTHRFYEQLGFEQTHLKFVRNYNS